MHFRTLFASVPSIFVLALLMAIFAIHPRPGEAQASSGSVSAKCVECHAKVTPARLWTGRKASTPASALAAISAMAPST
jgi:hypothetical protein